MELANRMEVEAAFARKLQRLSATHRAQLRDIAGWPPDPSRVPDSFWQAVEADVREQSIAVLLLLFLASSDQHSISATGERKRDAVIDAQGLAYATNRAGEIARGYSDSGREAFNVTARKAAERARQRSEQGERNLLTKTEWERDLTIVWPPSQAARTAASETTDARTAGGESGVRNTVGISAEDLWITEDDARVCPICSPLHERPRSEWSAKFPRGPKAHENCRCFIQYAYETAGVLA
jgi:hypothetical protein